MAYRWYLVRTQPTTSEIGAPARSATHASAVPVLPVPPGLALPDGTASGAARAAPVALAVEAAAPLLRRLAAIGRQIDTRLAEKQSAEKARRAEIPGYVRSTADATGETVTSEEPL